ncbi:MAG: O-antigen ligase family protein, partial [Acidimicrobiales bacterium]|nr:O-antigen ligase family protein [Acidimicrobiales bacterium]
IAISLPAGLYAVVESDTRTAFGALAVAGLVAAFDRAPMPLIVAGFVAAVLVYPQVDLADATSAVRRDSTEQLSELNGRTPIWRLSFNAIEQDPLTGAGLASGEPQIRAAAHGEGIAVFSASSHNHAIEIARELGLVGLGLALVALVRAAPWKSRRLRPLLAYLLVMSVTMPTSGLPGLITAAWFVVIATGSTSSPGVHSTALGEGRQESVGSIRGTDGRRLPLHQP